MPYTGAAIVRIEIQIYQRQQSLSVVSSGTHRHIQRFWGASNVLRRRYCYRNYVRPSGTRTGPRLNGFKYQIRFAPHNTLMLAWGLLSYQVGLCRYTRKSQPQTLLNKKCQISTLITKLRELECEYIYKKLQNFVTNSLAVELLMFKYRRQNISSLRYVN